MNPDPYYVFKTLFDFETIINMAFFTRVEDFRTVLNACLPVCDWETLAGANF